jgi:hypothetical protein
MVHAVPRDQVDEAGVHRVRWAWADVHFAAVTGIFRYDSRNQDSTALRTHAFFKNGPEIAPIAAGIRLGCHSYIPLVVNILIPVRSESVQSQEIILRIPMPVSVHFGLPSAGNELALHCFERGLKILGILASEPYEMTSPEPRHMFKEDGSKQWKLLGPAGYLGQNEAEKPVFGRDS